ncbi:MAG: tetratricopeptide repeat protein [Vibrio sp.]
MHKGILLLSLMLLTGCSSLLPLDSASKPATQNYGQPLEFDEEQLLIKTNNQAGLIALYKRQLQQQQNPTTRFKLAQAYFDSGDPESTLFTLAPLTSGSTALPRDELFFLQGRAQYQLNLAEPAHESLLAALQANPDSGKTLNLIGILYAQQGERVKARASFNRARELMFDDVTIKNNLALLDIFEQDYQSAAARLLPIYLNGQADQTVTANLALAMAQIGSYEHLRSFYGQQYGDQELYQLYLNLRQVQLINPVTESATTEPLTSHDSLSHSSVNLQAEEQVDASFVF